MKTKLIILITICTLINGCGLFKRTEKRIDRVEQSAIVEISKDVHKGRVDNTRDSSTSKEQTNTKERDQRDINNQTTVEADEISIDKDGNLSARGNAKLTNKNRDKGSNEKEENKVVDASSLSETNTESVEDIGYKEKQEFDAKDVNKETINKPSGKGIMYGSIAIILIIIVLAWWFFGKGKSK